MDVQACDAIMSGIDARLKQINPAKAEELLFLDVCLLQLSVVAKTTWFHCGCGEISPLSGLVDVICPKCGEIRRSGLRLNRSPWPLCISCLKRMKPEDWFEWLSDWLSERQMGQLIESGAYATQSAAGEAYSSAAKNSEAGGAAYEGVSRNSRVGATAPHRYIECIDGMRIFESSDIIGLNWIALPIPDSVLSSFPSNP